MRPTPTASECLKAWDESSRCQPVHALVKLTCKCCGLRAAPMAGIWKPELQLKFARHSWFVAGLLSKACSLAQQAMRDHHLWGQDPQCDSHAAAKAAGCPSLAYSWGWSKLKQPSIWKTGQLVRLVVLIKKKKLTNFQKDIPWLQSRLLFTRDLVHRGGIIKGNNDSNSPQSAHGSS